MWEHVFIVVIIVAAVGYAALCVYRGLKGKGGCSSCSFWPRCWSQDDPGPEDK